MKGIFFLLVGLTLVLPFENTGWKLRKDKNGIKVYTRKLEGFQLKEFKAETTLNVGFGEVEEALKNVPEFKTWFAKTEQSTLLKKLSPDDFYCYLVHTAPWPMKNRDIILRYTFTRPASGTLFLRIDGKPDYLPKNGNRVRMPRIKGSWTIKEISPGKTFAIMQMHTDPGGSVPSSLVNMAVVDSPYRTLLNLRKLLE